MDTYTLAPSILSPYHLMWSSLDLAVLDRSRYLRCIKCPIELGSLMIWQLFKDSTCNFLNLGNRSEMNMLDMKRAQV